MAVLFISHSSKDDALATGLEAWLRANGFVDIFIDHSMAGGEKWREALKASATSCRAIIFLVSENWLSSLECYGEFVAASYMGKRLIPLFVLPNPAALDVDSRSRLTRVRGEDQGIDMLPCIDAAGTFQIDANAVITDRLKLGLRAAGALARVGLDPEAFESDRQLRPTPFPGLASFGDDDADAALFYGRSREIAHTLEELRAMRATRDQRPLVILGASGAGKSSLLKAGIIPRLRREAPAWLPLRSFRPGADPLLNFAESLARTQSDFGLREAHGVIRDRLFAVWTKAGRDKTELTAAGIASLEAALDAEGKKLRDAAARPNASILISVDQAEEIARADGKSGEALADYLRAALATTSSLWQLAFTIRTDSYPELQRHRRFQDIEARGYDLRPIPIFRFESVVEGPAKRYSVKIAPELVDAMMEDAPKEDALPLLAFALQRLWHQYAASGSLTKDHYDKVGGLKGLIEDAAERALRGLEPEQDVPLQQKEPPKRLIELGRSTFVPALVQINDQGATIRRVPTWKAFGEDSQDLLEHFDRWRLVVRKDKEEADGGTVEVAHEALFREWGRLKEWLEPERARLEALRALQVDAAAWKRKGQDRAFLNHREERLAEAEALAADAGFARQMGNDESEYLAVCRNAELAANAKELAAVRNRQRLRAVVGLLMLGIFSGLIGWINQTYLKERLNWFMTMRPYMLTTVRPYVLTAEGERALKPGQTFRECAKDCPEMVVVPAGSFMMGTQATENGRDKNEGPQQTITISRPFAVSKFDVTFADWDACVAVGGCPAHSDSGYGRGNKPAINVNWDEAQQYAAWLSQMTGQSYRLLSESEFEFAARAGTTTAYPWGDDIGEGNANCNGCGSKWDNQETSPAGAFKPNAFGLYDMHGNVWKWVADCYEDTLTGVPANGKPRTIGNCSRRVVRGSSWYHNYLQLRSGYRSWFTSINRFDYLGFRLGRTIH